MLKNLGVLNVEGSLLSRLGLRLDPLEPRPVPTMVDLSREGWLTPEEGRPASFEVDVFLGRLSIILGGWVLLGLETTLVGDVSEEAAVGVLCSPPFLTASAVFNDSFSTPKSSGDGISFEEVTVAVFCSGTTGEGDLI